MGRADRLDSMHVRSFQRRDNMEFHVFEKSLVSQMSKTQDKLFAAVMEKSIDRGPNGMAQAFAALFNQVMRIERERFLGACHDEWSAARPATGCEFDRLGEGPRHRKEAQAWIL